MGAIRAAKEASLGAARSLETLARWVGAPESPRELRQAMALAIQERSARWMGAALAAAEERGWKGAILESTAAWWALSLGSPSAQAELIELGISWPENSETLRSGFWRSLERLDEGVNEMEGLLMAQELTKKGLWCHPEEEPDIKKLAHLAVGFDAAEEARELIEDVLGRARANRERRALMEASSEDKSEKKEKKRKGRSAL